MWRPRWASVPRRRLARRTTSSRRRRAWPPSRLGKCSWAWVSPWNVNASVRGPTLAAGLGELKCRCGIGSMAGSYEPRREQRAERQRDADAQHARRPAQAIEDLAQHGAAGQAAQEVAGKIEAACRAAVGRGGAANEAGGRGLGEEGTDADQSKANQQRGEARAQQ